MEFLRKKKARERVLRKKVRKILNALTMEN
jgi:hypothetical protein